MLDALFCRAFCFSPLLSLLLNGATLGDVKQPASAVSSEISSAEFPLASPCQLLESSRTLLAGEDLPTHPSLEDSPDVAQKQHTSNAVLPESNSNPAEVKGDTFFVYSYLNYVTMSCVSAFDDPDQFPEKLICFAGFQQTENAPLASEESSVDTPDENHITTKEESPIPGVSRRRPVTAIRLADSIVQFDESGQPLDKPEDSIPQPTTTLPAEHHYVPAPWHRSHASRNTYSIRYQPLYFEDPNMERCGETGGCLTEIKSIAHFAGRIPLLPYMMASNSPHNCVRALPDCPTCGQFGTDAYLPKPTVKAIAIQAAATVGAIYVIP